MDVSVVIGTYGAQEWVNLAHQRAIPSAQGTEVIHRHGTTLAQARNEALALVRTEWVIHLDADDELEPGYLEAMSRGSADLRAPAIRYVRNGRPSRPYVPCVAGHRHECVGECLRDGNWCCVGTAMRTEAARQVGGWEEWPVYEDWALMLRLYLAGATVQAVPDAIYRAHVRPDSRNRAPSIEAKNRTHHEIVAACA